MVFDDAFEETRAVLATECSDLAGTEYEKEPVIKWNYFYPHLKTELTKKGAYLCRLLFDSY